MTLQVRLIERGPTPDQNRDVAVAQGEFLIGRGADCDLRVRETAVSRHHCTIRVTADEATLVDLGSSNGTFVNSQRVRSLQTLHSGDRVQVGSVTFVVDLGDEKIDLEGGVIDSLAVTMKLPRKPKA